MSQTPSGLTTMFGSVETVNIHPVSPVQDPCGNVRLLLKQGCPNFWSHESKVLMGQKTTKKQN